MQPRGGNTANYQPHYQQHPQQPVGYGNVQQQYQQQRPIPAAGGQQPQHQPSQAQMTAASGSQPLPSHHHQHHAQFHHQQWQHQQQHHQQQLQPQRQQPQSQQEASTYYQQQQAALRAAYQQQQANYATAYYQQHAGSTAAPGSASAAAAAAAAAAQQQQAYYAQYYASHNASHSTQQHPSQRQTYDSSAVVAPGPRYPYATGAVGAAAASVPQQQLFTAAMSATPYPATGSHQYHQQPHGYQQQQQQQQFQPQHGSQYRGGYHHHHQHHHHYQNAFSSGTEVAPYPRGGGGYGGGGYRGTGGNFRGGFASYRGGDVRRGGGFGSSYHHGGGGHYGAKEYNFVVHVDSFEAVSAFERSTEPFSLLPSQTLARIQRTSRDSGDIHLLVVVGGRYLAGFFKRFDRHIRVIPQALAERFADVRWAVTEQGTPFYRTFDDGALIPRHYYISLRQVILDVMDMVSGERRPRRGVPEPEEEEGGEPVVIQSDADVLQLPPAKFSRLLVRNINVADAAIRLASIAQKGPAASDEARSAFAFFEALLDHDTHLFSSTIGLKLLDTLLLNREARAEIFQRLATHVEVDRAKVEAAAAAPQQAEPQAEAEKPTDGATTAAATTSDGSALSSPQPPSRQSHNLVETLGYGIFKQLLIHPFSTKFALQILGRVSLTLQDGAGRSEAEEDNEVRIFSRGFEVYGFDAVCGNLGGATLAALVGRYVFKAPKDDHGVKSQNVATCDGAQGESNAEGGADNGDGTTRKRSRSEGEDGGAEASALVDSLTARNDTTTNEPALVDSSKVLANREQFIRSIVVAFTRGVDTEAGITVGVLALARHVLACRTIQCMSPLILRAAAEANVPSPVLNNNDSSDGDSADKTAKHKKPGLSDAMPLEAKRSHTGRCFCFLEVLCSQAAVLMVDNYGNYVMQSLVEDMAKEIANEFSSRADGEGTSLAKPVVTLLRLLQRNIHPSLWDIATSKCGSNCVERFIVATATLPAEIGDECLVTLSDCVLGLGSQAFLQLCVHSFGNYAIRQMLQRLSVIAGASASTDGTEAPPTTTPSTWKAAAQKNEKLLFEIITRGLKTMEANVCATGIRSWYQTHAVRINAQVAPQAESRVEGN